MTLHTVRKLSCSKCGSYLMDKTFNEVEVDEDFTIDLMEYAEECGWVSERVPNGSVWDFCPGCYGKYKNGKIK